MSHSWRNLSDCSVRYRVLPYRHLRPIRFNNPIMIELPALSTITSLATSITTFFKFLALIIQMKLTIQLYCSYCKTTTQGKHHNV